MKKYVLNLSLLLASGTWAASVDVVSPDGRLKVVSDISDGRPVYSVSYDGKSILENSPLGIKSDIGDLSTGMSLVESRRGKVSKSFDQDKIKKSHIEYEANQLITTLKNSKGHTLDIEWLVSDNDIAFRYLIPCQGDTGAMVINEEVTGFRFPEQTTAFLTSQSDAMIGWKRTKPSYEEFYITDAPLDSASKFGQGFTFPALFRIGNDGWALLTETGVFVISI